MNIHKTDPFKKKINLQNTILPTNSNHNNKSPLKDIKQINHNKIVTNNLNVSNTHKANINN
jgi:hypothetical protein